LAKWQDIRLGLVVHPTLVEGQLSLFGVFWAVEHLAADLSQGNSCSFLFLGLPLFQRLDLSLIPYFREDHQPTLLHTSVFAN
jgi:hypothetical protein